MNNLELKNVSFSYNREKFVLKNISLSITLGSQIAIIGKNGAGKSTLAKLINGLLKPTKGSIYIHDMDTRDMKTSKIAHYVGYIFQNPDDQIFNTTVKKEIQFGIKNIDIQYYNEILDLTGLENKKNENPFDLSMYERKFINVSSTLLRKPEIIIMDEITGGQDKLGKEKIKKILHWLKKRNITVLFITHDINFICEIFNDIIIMAESEMIYHGSISNAFLDDNILSKASITKPFIMQFMEFLEIKNIRTKKDAISFLSKMIKTEEK